MCTKRDTYIFEKTWTYVLKTCVHTLKERYMSVKRHVYICQKRCIHFVKEWYIYANKDASIFRMRSTFVAVCCSVLHYVVVCCSVLQCVAVCYNMLQCVAVC